MTERNIQHALKSSLKSALHDRHAVLVSEGNSPNAAAAKAILEAKELLLVASTNGTVEQALKAAQAKQEHEDEQLEQAALSSLPPLVPHAKVASLNEIQVEDTSTMQLPAVMKPSAETTLKSSSKNPNCDTWRHFGMGTSAGRLLKSLYNNPNRVPMGSKSSSSHLPNIGLKRHLIHHPHATNSTHGSEPLEYETFIVEQPARGLAFRRSMNMADVDKRGKDSPFVPCGEYVQGERVDASWIKVGDRFLPTTVNSIRLLRRVDPRKTPFQAAAQPRHGNLSRAASAPSGKLQLGIYGKT